MLSWDQYLSGLNRALQGVDRDSIRALVDAILEAHAEDRFVYICGNGGSAATASHLVNDLVKAPAEAAGCRPIRAVGLADCVALMTALANDIEYGQMFAQQLRALGREGDLLVAISGSGNSGNVVEAARVAKEKGMIVAALTGFQGGKLKDLADVHVNVPCTCFGQIEDAHLVVQHAVVEMLKEALGGKSTAEIVEATV
jgi:D-sedoheptulose 7-phosphate isomerase